MITEQDTFPIHVSGHPGVEMNLRWMYRALRPNFVIPVHGEERHMASASKLADEMVDQLAVNGDVLHLDSTGGIALRACKQDDLGYLDRV